VKLFLFIVSILLSRGQATASESYIPERIPVPAMSAEVYPQFIKAWGNAMSYSIFNNKEWRETLSRGILVCPNHQKIRCNLTTDPWVTTAKSISQAYPSLTVSIQNSFHDPLTGNLFIFYNFTDTTTPVGRRQRYQGYAVNDPLVRPEDVPWLTPKTGADTPELKPQYVAPRQIVTSRGRLPAEIAINRLKSKHFTVLVGQFPDDNVAKFYAGIKKLRNYRTVRVIVQGKPYTWLLLGYYPTKNIAGQLIKKMPDMMKNENTVVKSMMVVQMRHKAYVDAN
jgi:hypothetical protein